MSEARKPYVKITSAEAKDFFDTPDSLVETKRNALYGKDALGRFAINAIAKGGGLVGIVFAPDDKGVQHPARIVNLGEDFGTPVRADYGKPFEDQYESLAVAAKEEERAENMAADTSVIKRSEIEALDTSVEPEATQQVDMRSFLDEGREAEVVPPVELEEEIMPEPHATSEEQLVDEDSGSEEKVEPTSIDKESASEKPWRQLSLAERLAGITEPEEEPEKSTEPEMKEFTLEDMEVAEAVSKIIDHATEQLDSMSKETVELASRFDETYSKAYRVGYTIEHSDVLPVLDDMRKTFGEHDARITDMQTETARYVKAEEDAPRQEKTEGRNIKQALRHEALETIEKLSEQLANMVEANSGVLEIQRKLDSLLRDHAQLRYYPDDPIFNGAVEASSDMVKNLIESLSARSESGKRIRLLIEDLAQTQSKLQTEE